MKTLVGSKNLCEKCQNRLDFCTCRLRGQAKKMLIPERGMVDTRRNRQWLALANFFGEQGCDQEGAESSAWQVIKLLERTK